MWSARKLVIYKLRLQQESFQVHFSLEIAQNHSWELKICGKTVNCNNQLLSDLPEFLFSAADVGNVLKRWITMVKSVW